MKIFNKEEFRKKYEKNIKEIAKRQEADNGVAEDMFKANVFAGKEVYAPMKEDFDYKKAKEESFTADVYFLVEDIANVNDVDVGVAFDMLATNLLQKRAVYLPMPEWINYERLYERYADTFLKD